MEGEQQLELAPGGLRERAAAAAGGPRVDGEAGEGGARATVEKSCQGRRRAESRAHPHAAAVLPSEQQLRDARGALRAPAGVAADEGGRVAEGTRLASPRGGGGGGGRRGGGDVHRVDGRHAAARHLARRVHDGHAQRPADAAQAQGRGGAGTAARGRRPSEPRRPAGREATDRGGR
eukprot:2990182-Prymnesium_polylepis.1